jgi:pimeloyl-ACP methyl ester carboxylesterase
MKSIHAFVSLWLTLFSSLLTAQTTTLYMLPGLGSTSHLFHRMTFDSNYTINHINYPVPDRNSTMQSYAALLSEQIDTSKDFVLIGTSIGGMLAVELADITKPSSVFIIASAKTRDELPPRYKFQRIIPLHKLIGSKVIKKSTALLQPIVEPDSKCDRHIYLSMLDEKDAVFMKRAVEMILMWDRTTYSNSIVHIHGSKDHTLPIRYTNPTVIIENGSHMMTLTHSATVQQIIEDALFGG